MKVISTIGLCLVLSAFALSAPSDGQENSLAPGLLCAAASPTDALVTANYHGAKPMGIITAFRKFTGKLVVVSAEVRTSEKRVSVSFEAKTKEEARDLLERALLAQAEVELVAQEDGSLLARRVQKKQENQPPAALSGRGSS
jgi:hypothetical protein